MSQSTIITRAEQAKGTEKSKKSAKPKGKHASKRDQWLRDLISSGAMALLSPAEAKMIAIVFDYASYDRNPEKFMKFYILYRTLAKQFGCGVERARNIISDLTKLGVLTPYKKTKDDKYVRRKLTTPDASQLLIDIKARDKKRATLAKARREKYEAKKNGNLIENPKSKKEKIMIRKRLPKSKIDSKTKTIKRADDTHKVPPPENEHENIDWRLQAEDLTRAGWDDYYFYTYDASHSGVVKSYRKDWYRLDEETCEVVNTVDETEDDTHYIRWKNGRMRKYSKATHYLDDQGIPVLIDEDDHDDF